MFHPTFLFSFLAAASLYVLMLHSSSAQTHFPSILHLNRASCQGFVGEERHPGQVASLSLSFFLWSTTVFANIEAEIQTTRRQSCSSSWFVFVSILQLHQSRRKLLLQRTWRRLRFQKLCKPEHIAAVMRNEEKYSEMSHDSCSTEYCQKAVSEHAFYFPLFLHNMFKLLMQHRPR